MGNRLFDVVCFGTQLQGIEREKACKALATILKVELQRAQELLAQNCATIRHAIPETDARALKQLLNRVGIRGGIRPSQPSIDELELVPLEEEEEGPRVITCPECQAKTATEKGQPEPEICPHCGLVFAKYERALRHSPELERIRQALRRPQQAEPDQAVEEADQGEVPVFQMPVEEAPAAPPQTPEEMGPRKPIAIVAATFFLAGAASGVAGWWLYSRFAAPKPADFLSQTGSTRAANQPTTPWTLPLYPGGSAPLIELLLAVESSEAKQPPPATAPRPIPETKTETLATAAAQLRRARRVDDLAAVFDQMALDYLQKGDRPVAAALLAETRKLTENLPDSLQSIETLAQTANVLEQAGDPLPAAAMLERALQQAGRLQPGMDRALAFATLAATAAWSGQNSEENRLFRIANHELLAIPDPSDRLQALCPLAERYALAGQRGGALALLEAVGRAAPLAQEAGVRDTLKLRRIEAHARIGDVDGALLLIPQLGNPGLQEAALHDVAVAVAERNNFTWAQELAERLKTPSYAADTFALLGQLRSGNPAEQQEALRSFAKAEIWAKLVEEPAAKVNVLGRLAKAYGLSDNSEKAVPIFETAFGAARSIEDPKKKDEALQTLAIVELTSLQPNLAAQTMKLITDPAMKAGLERKIEAVRRIDAILGAHR